MSLSPAVRGLNIRRSLADLARFSPGEQAQIRARIKPESLRAIELATDVSWIDLTISAEFNKAAYEVLGATRTRQWVREVAHAVIKRSMVTSMVESVIRLFGVKPHALLKTLPRGMSATYRDIGTTSTERASETSVLIMFVDLPDMMRTPSYLETLAGGFEAVFDVCDVPGHIDIERGPKLQMVAHWTPKR